MIILPSKSSLNFSSSLRLNVLFPDYSLFSWTKRKAFEKYVNNKRSVNLTIAKGDGLINSITEKLFFISEI